MANEEVTIDLSQNQKADENLPEYKYSGKEIKVTLTTDPPGSNFLKYTHEDKYNTDEEKRPFKLAKVRDDYQNDIIPDLPEEYKGKVTSVSAYYWNGNPTKVLLVGISTTDKGTTYYKNSGGGSKWIEQTLDGNNLEKVLNTLNCQHNNAVTINLSNSLSTGGKQTCCDHHKDEKRISVDKGEIIRDDKKTEYTKYSISSGKVAGVTFYKDGASNDEKNRRHIRSNKLTFPIEGQVDIYTFYSSKNPVLIYVDHDGEDQGVTGWYQKSAVGNGNEKWIEATNLKDIKKNIDNKQLDCRQWTALVEVLDKHGTKLQECPQEKLEQLPQQERRTDPEDDAERQKLKSKGQEDAGERGLPAPEPPDAKLGKNPKEISGKEGSRTDSDVANEKDELSSEKGVSSQPGAAGPPGPAGVVAGKAEGFFGKEGTTYKYYDGKQWKDGNENKHKTKFGELKEKYKHTLISLNIVKPDGSNIDVHTETESGVSFKGYSPKEGHHISSVLDGDKELWKSSGDERCLLVECYEKEPTEVIYLEVESNGTKSRYFERNGTEWKDITEGDFFKKLDKMTIS